MSSISMGHSGTPPSQLSLSERSPLFSSSVTPGHRVPVVDKSKVDPEILKAAEGMEAMFLDYMMKVMRQTVPKNEMDLDSPATEVYRSMLDTETAQRAAHAGGIGLADQIIAYLQPQSYHLSQGKQSPLMDQRKASSDDRRTGGTYEGKSVR